MGIRSKTVLITIGVLAIAIGAFVFIGQKALVRGFVSVEDAEMRKNITRGVDAVTYNLGQINAKGYDWSYWNETYAFVQGKGPDYIETNLTPVTISGQKINYMIFFNKAGKLVASRGYDLETHDPLPDPTGLLKLLTPTSKFLTNESQDGIQAIAMLPEGPMMIVARPVLHEDTSGPRAGTVIFAAYINAAKAKELSELSELPLAFYPYDATDLPADVKAYRTGANAGKTAVTPLNGKTVAAYAVMPDMFGRPGLIVRTEQPRSILEQGQKTLDYFIYGVILTGIALAFILAWLLNRLVSGPVSRLAREVGHIGDGGNNADLARVYQPKGTDEVGRLAGSINTMLGSLAEAHDRLAHEKDLVEAQVVERTKELAEAQAELAASVRSLPFGFAVVNTSHEIMFSNELLASLVDRPIPADRAKSRQALRAINKSLAGTIDLLADIHAAQTERRPIERQVSLGTKFFRFFFTPVASKTDSHEILGTVVIMQDVSEEKAIQRSRDEFFSIASHELRTPLTAIRGNSDMMLQYYPQVTGDPEVHQMVSDVHDASIRLIDIVNDFLDMSRLEQGKVVFKPEDFDAAELIPQILREYDVTGSRQKLKLEFVPGSKALPLVHADKDRVRQIIVNLIGNAVKATTDGSVTVKASVSGKTVKLAVTDTGHGIAPENQHLLFHKFQQAEDSILTRDDTNSTGLGLYISRMLAEGMDGKLYLDESEIDKGSTFVLEVPKA